MVRFNELVKSFEKIRVYMRAFCVFGYKTRAQMNLKSTRSYDTERYRIESFLGNYVKQSYTSKGKVVAVSADMKENGINPLYVMWQTKSYTKNDILIHFAVLDSLSQGKALTVYELADEIMIKGLGTIDPMLIRIKMKEYSQLGLIETQKEKKQVKYAFKKPLQIEALEDAINFLKNILPLGVLGYFIEDKDNLLFAYQHTYFIQTIDDEVLLKLLSSIEKNRSISFTYLKKEAQKQIEDIIPLKILDNVENGRRYLVGYHKGNKHFYYYKLDGIKDIYILNEEKHIADYQQEFEKLLEKSWGVVFKEQGTESVWLKLFIDETKEGYILDRIRREGERGIVERIGENLFLYTNEVADAYEMLPWIRTFIGRIIELKSDNKQLEDTFWREIKELKQIYEV